MRNISKITMYGGSYNSQKVWENIYDCFDMAIKETKSAYLDAGARKREYLAIYNDIVKHNVELTKYLRILAGAETAEQFSRIRKSTVLSRNVKASPTMLLSVGSRRLPLEVFQLARTENNK